MACQTYTAADIYRTRTGVRTMSYGWDTELQTTVSLTLRSALSEADELFAAARYMIANPESADVGQLLSAYAKGIGTHADVAAFRFRQLVDELALARGEISDRESLFNAGWSPTRDAFEKYCPELAWTVFDLKTNEDLDSVEFLEWCPNEVVDTTWPRAIAGFMRRSRRIPFGIYRTDNAAVYVDPHRYQILTRDLNFAWETGSPRGLSRLCVEQSTPVDYDGDIVVVQDRFNFRNFSHFLFDAVTRIMHFVDQLGYNNELLVFGGIPGEYHTAIGSALQSAAKIPWRNMLFPSEPILLRPAGQCVWFSDQKALHAHPAQMAHPRSLALLNRVTSMVPGRPGPHKRIYISRGDADRRRVVNETDLITALERLGFKSFRLSELSTADQISLFRGAEIVIGPHGMGLTHIAMGSSIAQVIELFHPTAGTDAYAFFARSAGLTYNYILGQAVPATHADFLADVDRVIDHIIPDSGPAQPRRRSGTVNLLPGSRTFRDFSLPVVEPGKLWPGFGFARLSEDHVSCAHWKHGPATNTNVGAWSSVNVIPDRWYTASCWVWIPQGFDGQRVSIRLDYFPSDRQTQADLSLRNAWQRISYSAKVPDNVRQCSVGLHIEGEAGAGIVSTCWQLEVGDNASSYVATP